MPHKSLPHKETTILEIALKYGYDTHEGFTRSFRAYMGVTPAEYRKYHCAVSSPAVPKERCVMMYSKVTDEMLRELNALIVQAKEAADYTRKTVQPYRGTVQDMQTIGGISHSGSL